MRSVLLRLAIVLGAIAFDGAHGTRAWAQQPTPAGQAAPAAGSAAPAAGSATGSAAAPAAAEQPAAPAAGSAAGSATDPTAAQTAAPSPTGGPGPATSAPPVTGEPAQAGSVPPPPGATASAPGTAPPTPPTNAPKPKAWYEKFNPNDWDHAGTYWLPPSASATSTGPDKMFYAVLGLSIFFFVGICVAVTYFVVKYRHRPGHKAEPSPAHNDVLEMTWTIIPTIMCVFLFVYGWRTYLDNNLVPETKPENQVYAIGSKWSWNFRYYNGVEEPVLHAPLGEPVKVIITSTDVLHSFFVPAFRIKQDAVPRRYTYAWFYPTKLGIYRLYCAEYCGTDHSQMKTRVVVHSASDYRRFLDDAAASRQSLAGAPLGAAVYEKKGCIGCHTVDGSPRIGPSWKGSWGTQITLADGNKVTVDEAYIHKAIVSPGAEGRSGFPIGTMPVTPLSDKEIEGVIEYIKSLK